MFEQRRPSHVPVLCMYPVSRPEDSVLDSPALFFALELLFLCMARLLKDDPERTRAQIFLDKRQDKI